jgi:hypothetical protein
VLEQVLERGQNEALLGQNLVLRLVAIEDATKHLGADVLVVVFALPHQHHRHGQIRVLHDLRHRFQVV